jgi:hypothetical protein
MAQAMKVAHARIAKKPLLETIADLTKSRRRVVIAKTRNAVSI